jgi:hypothetical protein
VYQEGEKIQVADILQEIGSHAVSVGKHLELAEVDQEVGTVKGCGWPVFVEHRASCVREESGSAFPGSTSSEHRDGGRKESRAS